MRTARLELELNDLDIIDEALEEAARSWCQEKNIAPFESVINYEGKDGYLRRLKEASQKINSVREELL